MRGYELRSLCVGLLVLLAFPGTARAIPVDEASFTGFLDLEVEDVQPPPDDGLPFDLASVAPGDVYSAFFKAEIAIPPADDTVPDGDHEIRFSHFALVIGNTSWDETASSDAFARIADGNVIGLAFNITITIPEHPDLQVFMPGSPGTWQADDIVTVGGVTTDNGSLSGIYSLRAVPAPTTLALIAIGLAGLGFRRWTH